MRERSRSKKTVSRGLIITLSTGFRRPPYATRPGFPPQLSERKSVVMNQLNPIRKISCQMMTFNDYSKAADWLPTYLEPDIKSVY